MDGGRRVGSVTETGSGAKPVKDWWISLCSIHPARALAWSNALCASISPTRATYGLRRYTYEYTHAPVQVHRTH